MGARKMGTRKGNTFFLAPIYFQAMTHDKVGLLLLDPLASEIVKNNYYNVREKKMKI